MPNGQHSSERQHTVIETLGANSNTNTPIINSYHAGPKLEQIREISQEVRHHFLKCYEIKMLKAEVNMTDWEKIRNFYKSAMLDFSHHPSLAPPAVFAFTEKNRRKIFPLLSATSTVPLL